MYIRWVLILLTCAAAIGPCGADPPAKMLSERAACTLLKQRLTLTVKPGSDCLFASSSEGPWFVVALSEHCGLCTYSLTDWYTVDRRTGDIRRSARRAPGAG